MKEHSTPYQKLPAELERNRYFQGKFMTARDFQADQDYFLDRQRLQNRLTFGWGVACGLWVDHHPRPECQGHVVIRPGVAIDDLGREILLDRPFSFDLKKAWDDKEAAKGEAGSKAAADKKQSNKEPGDSEPADEPLAEQEAAGEREMLLCVQYGEQQIEKVPVLYSGGNCAEREAFNRIREQPVFSLECPQDERCWARFREGRSSLLAHEDAASNRDCDDGSCFATSPCGQLVPLAIVRQQPDGNFEWDCRGRTYVYIRKPHFTTIKSFNWQHGKEHTLLGLRERYNNSDAPPLAVEKDDALIPFYFEFSNELLEPTEDIVGLVRLTIISERASAELKEGTLAETIVNLANLLKVQGKYLHFSVPQSVFKGMFSSESRARVTLTLFGDFLTDCHGNPVDVNFLRGAYPPEGNGTPGGQFVSWFSLVQEDDVKSPASGVKANE